MVITHYRTIELREPDFVHVLYNGKIVKAAIKFGPRIEAKGYDWIKAENT